MGFDLEELSSSQSLRSPVTDGCLVLLNGVLVDDRPRTNSNMIILGEDPSVEIRRDVVSNVHFGELLVVFHLVLRELDPLLECDRIRVLSRIDGLGHARIRSVRPNDHVNFEDALFSLPGLLCAVVRVFNFVLAGTLRHQYFRNEPVDRLRAEVDRAIAEESVKNFSPCHSDILVRLQGSPNVRSPIARRNHLHLSDSAIDDLRG
mmetsp:Transcript_25120/g.99067  ORF Transcript_25120/g.99067 Transcript_25120/m.99067 type:complete len:205 (-) Transcript_25120:506-1120(-)